MLRLLTINFYIYLIRKKCNIKLFFLLFDNKNIIEKDSNIENRFKIMKILFLDILISYIMIIQIVFGILNPFFSLKIIKNTYLYFIISKNETQIEFKQIEIKYIFQSFRTILKLLYFYLIYLPISLILHIIAFWTIKYNIKLLISNNKHAFSKLKIFNTYRLNYINNINNVNNNILSISLSIYK